MHEIGYEKKTNNNYYSIDFFVVVGITIAAAVITGIYDPDNTVVGNNLTSSG